MAATTKLITKATFILVTTDGKKETRQQMKKVEYEYRDFDRDQFDTMLTLASNTLDN